MNLSSVKKKLDELFPEGWSGFEPEALLPEPGLEGATLDQLYVLKILAINPEAYLLDSIFLLHFINVCNEGVSDFETLPEVTSLELAWTLIEALTMFPSTKALWEGSAVLVEVTKHILKSEGYTSIPSLFQYIGMPWSPEGNKYDAENKVKALVEYIGHKKGSQ